MKKILLVALAAFSLTSCSDFLDKEPDTELTIDQVFQQKNLQERWLSHCYSSIPDPYFHATKNSGVDILGDDLSPSERWQQWGWNVIPFLSGNWNTQSSWDGPCHWATAAKRIRNCLIFQQRATAVPEEGLSSSEVALMKAEARFLVAYYSWMMLKTYGPFCFNPTEIVPTEFNLADLMVGQTPMPEIVEWIDKELLELSEILPASYSSSNKYGRATSIMCLAVRARMLLFVASPLVNGNEDYYDCVDREGNHLYYTSKDDNMWKRAADASKLLIDKAHEAGHELYYEYDKDGNIDPFLSCQNLFLPSVATNCKEILFARPSCDYGEYEKHSTSTGMSGNGGLGVTQRYVDAFFMKNGLRKDDDGSGYVENGFSTEDDIRNTSWPSGEPTGDANKKNIAHKGTFNMYVNREPRFYVWVNYSGKWCSQLERYYDFKYQAADNNGTHDAPQNGYLNRKRVHPDYRPNYNTGKYRPGILYRLGEAYLNYAEALNEVGGNTTEVLFYLNKIRERAGIRQYQVGASTDEYIGISGDKDELRELIHAERRIELSCENGIRYDDLRRWKKAEEELNFTPEGMNFYATTDEEYYQRVELNNQSARVYKKAFYWWPIYQDEMDKNPNLVQAPYWTAAAD